MSNFVIDIGNSSVKWGIFADGRLCAHGSLPETSHLSDVPCLNKCSRSLSCNVSADESIPDALDRLMLGKHTRLSHHTPLPIGNGYKQPARLGPDRLAGAAGAAKLFPGRAALVVDAGTALTIDFIDQNAVYKGGSISPGAHLRFLALHQHTGRLPLLEATNDYGYGGVDTSSAITNGVMQGMLAEIEGHRAHYQKLFPGLATILTGGSAKYFENKLKSPIFAEPALVLHGLDHILDHNRNE